MKFKKIIAALLCAAQLLSVTAVLAEDQETVEEITETSDVSADTEVNPDGEIRIYVAPDGSDGNDGSFGAPVATIERGIALATILKNSNAGKTVAVTIRGGEYRITKTITLGAQHSGTEANPFIIQSYNGEEVNIMGSTKLTPSKFKGVSDEATLARLPVEAHGYVGVYDLSKEVSELSAYSSYAEMGGNTTGYYELITDGKDQTLARWPNTGWDYTKKVESNSKSFTGENSGSRVSRWKTATNASLCGYFDSEYAYSDIAITGINGQNIEIGTVPYYGLSIQNRYWVKNLLEELDMPGEYYIDTAAKKLYYYPPYGILGSEIELTTLNVPMFSGSGLSNVTFRGLNVKNARSHAFNLPNSKNVVIDGCTIENIGHKGIIMSNSTDCKITNNIIRHIGSNAIVISGGDRNTLTMSNNLIDNNHIYDFAYLFRSNNPGIALEGVGTTITNNCINSSPSQAILYHGNEHKIMYNEFYDLVNEPCDAGAIYTGRNYTYRGNEIAYNYFHDMQTKVNGGSIFVCGVYLDDMASSANIHHNVFYNSNQAIMIGGGRDSTLENNLILECNSGMFLDARGVGWAYYHADPPGTEARSGQAYKTIFAVPYNKEPWASRYPELLETVADIEHLGRPAGNVVKDNVSMGCGSQLIANEMKEYGTVENNTFEKIVDKTAFEDYDNRNFNVKEGSALAKEHPGLLEIDMEKIGLREDMKQKVTQIAAEETMKLVGPSNGETGITNLGYTFQWDEHPTADKYIVRIADDPEMKNVVLTHEAESNISEIKYIPSGGKPYWWTVEGVNESQSMKASYTQLGAPRLFTTTLYEQTEKKELRNNITVLTTLETAIVEGNTPGTYKKGFKERVINLKMEMEAANNSGTVLQVEINELNERYEELIESIKDNINYEVINVGELLENQDRWIYTEGKYTFKSDGSLELRGSDGTRVNHYTNMIYDEPLGDNVAIKFGYKVNVSSNYCIIGLQNDATFLRGGYDLIIKSNQIEIQRCVDGTNVIKSTALNFYISDDKWVDLELGALKTGIGTFVYLTADGYMIDSFLDMDTPAWSGESKFIFGNPSGTLAECYASIRPAQD